MCNTTKHLYSCTHYGPIRSIEACSYQVDLHIIVSRFVEDEYANYVAYMQQNCLEGCAMLSAIIPQTVTWKCEKCANEDLRETLAQRAVELERERTAGVPEARVGMEEGEEAGKESRAVVQAEKWAAMQREAEARAEMERIGRRAVVEMMDRQMTAQEQVLQEQVEEMAQREQMVDLRQVEESEESDTENARDVKSEDEDSPQMELVERVQTLGARQRQEQLLKEQATEDAAESTQAGQSEESGPEDEESVESEDEELEQLVQIER